MSTVIKTAATRRMTVRDLYQVEGKAELVHGRIVRMSPTGRRPNRVAANIFMSLRTYEQITRRGEAYTDNAAFLCSLPNRGSFAPDASYYTGPAPIHPDDFLPAAPDFAVEVRSKGDYGRSAEKRLKTKRRDYFAAGTRVVWDVDPAKKTVTAYRASDPDRPRMYRAGQVADAEPAVPGWRMAVDEVFA